MVGGPVMEWNVKSPAPAGTEFARENGNEIEYIIYQPCSVGKAQTEPCLCVLVVGGGVGC